MPSMSGMWMSVSTRSAGALCRRSSASRPCWASPTTVSGSAVPQSSSRSRKRRRAGASSSTTNTRIGASGMDGPSHESEGIDAARAVHLALRARDLRRSLRLVADRIRIRSSIWQPYVNFVTVLGHARVESRFGIEVQRETLAHVGERHLVARMVPSAVLAIRVLQYRVHLTAGEEHVDGNDAGLARRLDAVVH